MGTLEIIFEVSAQEVRERADRSPAFSRTIGTTHARPAEPAPIGRQPSAERSRARCVPAPIDHALKPIARPCLPIGRTTTPNDRQTAQFTRASCRSIARHSRSIAKRPAFQSRVALSIFFEYLNSLVYFKPTLACKSLFKGGFQPQKDIEFGL